MTVTNSIVAKLSVAFVAVATAFVLAAPAQAQMTSEEMQSEIDRLTALIEQLTGQLSGQSTGGGTMSSSSVCPFTWTRDLSQGSTGADVMKLQQFLNATDDTRVAVSGAGSVGAETEYYGPATAAAVSKFQTKFRTEILSPAGLVNPTGYFGPSSRAQANSLCVSAPVMDDSMDDDAMDDDDMDDDDSTVSLSGEGSLGDTRLSEGDDTDIEEGQEDAPVADLELTFDNGDVIISRIDISLVAQGTEDDVWDTFENVSIWLDGEKIAEKSADSKSDYLGDEDNGVLRLTGLDVVAPEDEEMKFTLAVTTQTGINSLDATWDINALNVRYTDADDVTTTDTISETATSFDISTEGGDDELNVRSSSDDPDATTIAVEETSKSGWETIFVFDLDSDDSVNDITVDGVTVNVTTDDAEGNVDVVSDIRLVIDGEEFDDWSVDDSDQLSANYTFDLDNDLVIDAGDRVPVEVQVKFLQQSGNFAEGTTIQGTTSAATLDAEGADTLTVAASQLSGTATGDVHTLRTQGAVVEFVSSTETLKENSDTTTDDDEGVFTVKFDVTAFETDLYFGKTAASGTATTSATDGVTYLITDGSGGTPGGTTTPSASLSSTADTDGTKFVVREGETETFTLTVTYNPGLPDLFWGVQLYSVAWEPTNAAANTLQLVTPASDFESDPLSI